MRGSKAVALFSVYLLVVLAILLVTYDNIISSRGVSLAATQFELKSFYYTLLGCLGGLMVVVAPAIGAFAIINEKQRRSLDLVFTAPVRTNQYLIGKVISTYRYLWLLLVLSLPFASVSVVLGGVTWSQLLVDFVVISFFGLFAVTIGLFFSCVVSKVTQALGYTIVTILGYLFFSTIFAAGTFGRMTTTVPIISTLSPIGIVENLERKVDIFGLLVPVWIVTVGFLGLFSKIVIDGASCALAQNDRRLIRKLRISGLIYFAAFFGVLGPDFYDSISSIGMVTGGLGNSQDLTLTVSKFLCFLFVGLSTVLVPYLSGFGRYDLKRHEYDGLFQFRKVFSGRPSGALPYFILVLGVSLGSFIVGYVLIRSTRSVSLAGEILFFDPHFWSPILMCASTWLAMWAVGMYGSSLQQVLAHGRTASFLTTILIFGFPTVIVAVLVPEGLYSQARSPYVNLLPNMVIAARVGEWGFFLFHSIWMLFLSIFFVRLVQARMKNPLPPEIDPNSMPGAPPPFQLPQANP